MSAADLFAKKKKGKKKFKAFNANSLDVSDVSSSQHVDDVSQKGEQQGKGGVDVQHVFPTAKDLNWNAKEDACLTTIRFPPEKRLS